MPSKTARQARAMAAAAHGKSKVGIPRSVGEEFHEADKRKARKGKGGLRKGAKKGPRRIAKRRRGK